MIDLKKTAAESKTRQSHLVTYFSEMLNNKVAKQHINKMFRTNSISKGWNIAFMQYFKQIGAKIYYITK